VPGGRGRRPGAGAGGLEPGPACRGLGAHPGRGLGGRGGAQSRRRHYCRRMPFARVRREHRGQELLDARSPPPPRPTPPPWPPRLRRRWLARGVRSGLVEPSAATLATVDARGRPRARMVLVKRADESGFTFYTNRRSAKARELERRPEAALVMWWPELHRQVR